MGRAQIIGGGSGGRYTIAIDLGEAERTELASKLTAQVADAQAKLITAQLTLTDKTAARDAAAAVYDDAVAAYIGMERGEAGELTDAERQAITDAYETACTDYSAAVFAHAQAMTQKNAVSFSLKALRRSLTQAQELPLTDVRPAWCADYTQNASGTVATIEVPGESNLVLIAPGGRAAADTDGRLFARELMSPAQAFFNAASLPGWQKHMPTYRSGTLLSKNTTTNRGSVLLSNTTSSAANININKQEVLENLFVEYMSCGIAAFSVGDMVLVKFYGGSWSNPRIIGFVDNPKKCCSGSVTLVFEPGVRGNVDYRFPEITIDIQPQGATPQFLECGETSTSVSYPFTVIDSQYEISMLDTIVDEWKQVAAGIAEVVVTSPIFGPYTALDNPGGDINITISRSTGYMAMPGFYAFVGYQDIGDPDDSESGPYIMWLVGTPGGETYPTMPPILFQEELVGDVFPGWDYFDGRTITHIHSFYAPEEFVPRNIKLTFMVEGGAFVDNDFRRIMRIIAAEYI